MRAAVFVLLAVFCLVLGPVFAPVQAQAVAAAQLGEDIDEFFSKGADGFVVWQYGGDYNARKIAVDQYSFYRDRDKDICQVMKEKASANPDKFIGVNINNIGANEFVSGGVATEHMTWLRDNCGVTKVRIFAKIDDVENGVVTGAGVKNALAAAPPGVQIIVAIGDYSNGGGGMPRGAGKTWYESGYTGAYLTLVNALAPLKTHPSLHGFELANEPHCGGDVTAKQAYANWGAAISAILAPAQVGYGQMASQNTTRCDSPGPGDFIESNAIPGITMTSAHYYNDTEKANALMALSQSRQLGKPFYIGEAPPGDIGAEGQTFEADDNVYYLHPIRGVTPGGAVSARSVDVIREDLAMQGYEPHCASPKAEIKLDIKTIDTMNRFISLYGGIDLNALSSYSQETSNTRTPIYRDVNTKRFFNSSLEEYFGFIDSTNTDPTRAEIQTAPVNSLLSSEQRCVQTVKALFAAELMCERLTDPAKCALLGRPVVGTDMNVQQFLDKIEPLIPYREGKAEEGCRALFGDSSNKWNELQEALVNTPYYLDRSYRLAFLVTTLEYKRYNPPTLFNLYRQRFRNDAGAQEDPRHEVLITAFKIPDILTNKGGGETSGHVYWDDPAIITRNTLVPKQTGYDVYKAEADNFRRELVSLSKNASIQTNSSPIYCTNGTIASPACDDELGKAVVDLINGRTPSCHDLRDEPVTEIDDSGRVPFDNTSLDETGLRFDPGYGFGTLLFQELFKNYEVLTKKDPHRAETETLESLFHVYSGWQIGPSAQANFYLVYPLGYELEEVTNVFERSFFTTEQTSAMLANDQPATRFELKNATSGFIGGGTGREYDDTSDPANCTQVVNPITGAPLFNPITGNPIMQCPRKNFSLDLIEDKTGGPALIGARLGYWLRKTQLSLNPLYSASYAYFKSCRSTEEFLLGRCAGGPARNTPGSPAGSTSTP